MKPKGKLKFHSIEVRDREHAVYYNVRFEDEEGNLFDGYASHFKFDLKPVLQQNDSPDREYPAPRVTTPNSEIPGR